jgi:sugar phosphate isomerase/epimerase
VETEDGGSQEFVLPSPGTKDITDFPLEMRAHTGISTAEICQVQVPNSTPADIDKLAASLEAAGVDVLTVPIDIGNIANPDPVRRRGYLQEIRRWIDIAARLGAPFARVNAGAPTGAPNNSRAALLESLSELADHAASVGVSLLVENHGGDSSDPEWLIAVCEEVGRERLGIILDTGNLEPMISIAVARFSGQPVDEAAIDFEPVYGMIERLAPYATIVHAKAYDVEDDGSFGPVDLRRALTIVRAAGFDGPITVEYEGPGPDVWERTSRTVALVREVFAR